MRARRQLGDKRPQTPHDHFSIIALRPFPLGSGRGQIVTFLVVIMAVLILMMMMLLNLGQIAQHKTDLSKAADQAALGVASQVGQMSLTLLELNGGQQEKCKTDWSAPFKIIGGILAGVLLILTGYGIILGIIVIAAAIALTLVDAYVILPSLVGRINKHLRNLSQHDQIREGAIISALLSGGIAEDPNTEPDVLDLNENGDKQEKIPSFAAWLDAREMCKKCTVQLANIGQVQNLVASVQTFVTKYAEPLVSWLDNDLPVALQYGTDLSNEIKTKEVPLRWTPGLPAPSYWAPGVQYPGCTIPEVIPTTCPQSERDQNSGECFPMELPPSLDPVTGQPTGPVDELEILSCRIKGFIAFANELLHPSETAQGGTTATTTTTGATCQDLQQYPDKCPHLSSGTLLTEDEGLQVQIAQQWLDLYDSDWKEEIWKWPEVIGGKLQASDLCSAGRNAYYPCNFDHRVGGWQDWFRNIIAYSLTVADPVGSRLRLVGSITDLVRPTLYAPGFSSSGGPYAYFQFPAQACGKTQQP